MSLNHKCVSPCHIFNYALMLLDSYQCTVSNESSLTLLSLNQIFSKLLNNTQHLTTVNSDLRPTQSDHSSQSLRSPPIGLSGYLHHLLLTVRLMRWAGRHPRLFEAPNTSLDRTGHILLHNEGTPVSVKSRETTFEGEEESLPSKLICLLCQSVASLECPNFSEHILSCALIK